MDERERLDRLTRGLRESARNLRGVLADLHEVDDDLAEHWIDELEWLLNASADEIDRLRGQKEE